MFWCNAPLYVYTSCVSPSFGERCVFAKHNLILKFDGKKEWNDCVFIPGRQLSYL